MTSYKNQLIRLSTLVFLVYLHTAHAHYVPCTIKSPGKTITTVTTTIPTDTTTSRDTTISVDSTITTATDITSNSDNTAVIDTTTTSITAVNTDTGIDVGAGVDTITTFYTTASIESPTNKYDTTVGINSTTDFDTTAGVYKVTSVDSTTTTVNGITQKSDNTADIDTTSTTERGIDLTTLTGTTSSVDIASVDNYTITGIDSTTTTITDNIRLSNSTAGIDTTTISIENTVSQSESTTSIDTTITTTTVTNRHSKNNSSIDTTATTVATGHTITTPGTDKTTSSTTTSSTDILETSESPIISSTIPPNLYSPVFYEDIYYGDVYEDVPIGTVLLTVQALDWDQGGAGEIIYNISSGAEDAEDRTGFAVHPVTGVVAIVGRLDREKKGVYMINLTATDQGQPERLAIALLGVSILDVNDNAPTFGRSRYEVDIDENANLMSRVLHVTAIDADIGTNSDVTYKLSGNHKNTFTIDERSGLIRTQRSLDRERVAQYSFLVTAIDHGAPAQQGTAAVLVRIGDTNDNPPNFHGNTIYLNITENNMPFSPIGKVTATDADEGPNAVILYAFVQRVPQNMFQIERRTGIVHTLYRFDREQRSEYEVAVRASSGRLFTDARLVIHINDLNDNIPMVPETQEIFYNFYAESDGCYAIGKVGALDKDSGDSLKFQVLAGNKISPGVTETRRQSANSSENEPIRVLGMRFTVDRNTGMIHACHRPSSHIPSTAQLAVEVSDGLHSKTCVCTIYLSRVTDRSLGNCISLRLRIRTDVETFLLRIREFRSTIAGIFRTAEELVTVLIWEGLAEAHGDSESQVLMRIMIAARRRDGTIVTPNVLRSMVYLELEQLQVFADILPDPVRLQCRLVSTVTGGANVVTEVALGMTYTYFNVSFKVSCDKNSGFCGSETCGRFEECVGQNNIEGDELGCRCLFSGDTNCQPPFPTGNCSEAVCNHRGSCVVDDAGDVNCLCREQGKYNGPRCQMTTRSFTDESFLAFMPLGRLSRDFHISLRFKTNKPSGLLLYNGQRSGKGESIALQIVGNRLQFRKSGRAGANSAGTSASIATNVSDGRWHNVYVNHLGGNVLMGIDNCTGTATTWNVTDADPSCLSIGVQRRAPRAKFLNLNGPLFLGGLPSFVTTSQVTLTHFEGCLQAVEIDAAVLDFSKRLKNVGTTPRCSERNNPTTTTTTKIKAPRPVRSLSVRPRMRTLIVKWILPKDKSGQVIGYQISYVTVNGTGHPLIKAVIINSPSETSYMIERLTPDTRYQVTIRAFTTAGFGDATTVYTKTKNSKAIK